MRTGQGDHASLRVCGLRGRYPLLRGHCAADPPTLHLTGRSRPRPPQAPGDGHGCAGGHCLLSGSRGEGEAAPAVLCARVLRTAAGSP